MSCQLDETALEPALSRLPAQIERIDGNAVTAQARSGVERHEPERLRPRGVDDFPHVDVHLLAHQRQLVHQPDVDSPKRVFEQLHHLGDAGRRDRDDGGDDLLVERSGDVGRGLIDAADDFRRVARVPLGICRIDALRRKREKEVAPGDQSAPFEHRAHHFFGGAGVSGRLEHHQLTCAQILRHLLDRRHDVR
jgi:hypothetical protein